MDWEAFCRDSGALSDYDDADDGDETGSALWTGKSLSVCASYVFFWYAFALFVLVFGIRHILSFSPQVIRTGNAVYSAVSINTGTDSSSSSSSSSASASVLASTTLGRIVFPLQRVLCVCGVVECVGLLVTRLIMTKQLPPTVIAIAFIGGAAAHVVLLLAVNVDGKYMLLTSPFLCVAYVVGMMARMMILWADVGNGGWIVVVTAPRVVANIVMLAGTAVVLQVIEVANTSEDYGGVGETIGDFFAWGGSRGQQQQQQQHLQQEKRRRQRQRRRQQQREQRGHAEASASWWGTLTFSWVSPLLEKGYVRVLEATDMLPMYPGESAREDHERFSRAYRREERTARKEGRGVSLLRVLWREFGWEWANLGWLKLVNDVCVISGPLYLSYLVDYIEDGNPQWDESAVLLAILFVLQMTKTVCMCLYFHRSYRLAFVVRGGLMGAIYQQALTLAGSVRQACTAGELVNLLSVDTETVTFEMIPYLHYVWSTVLQAAVCMYLLWGVLGISSLFVYAVLIVAVAPALYCVQKVEEYSKSLFSLRDKRTKLVNELLQGVKVIKYQSWGDAMTARIRTVREEELALLRRIRILESVNGMLWSCLPIVSSFVAFVGYAYLNGESLSSADVFTAVALINVLKFPLIAFPYIIIGVVMMAISLARLERFFAYEQIDRAHLIRKIIDAHASRPSSSSSSSSSSSLPATRLAPVAGDDFEDEIDVDDDDDDDDDNDDRNDNNDDDDDEIGEKNMQATAAAAKSNYVIEMRKASFTWMMAPVVSLDGKKVSGMTGTVVEVGPKERLADVVAAAAAATAPVASLRSVTVRIPRGKLTVVVGPVGSGKSSLLQAMIGDMRRLGGVVAVRTESMAYLAQQPWIINAKLRDNIVFGQKMDEDRFARVVVALALQPDIDALPAGVDTEIGEKGINLSGGQRARVALARACYCNADLFLLDDVLSAVDSHVAKHIMKHCILGPLMSESTRVLVTHADHYLPRADWIVVMKDGSVAMQGTYADIVAQGYTPPPPTVSMNGNGGDDDGDDHDKEKVQEGEEEEDKNAAKAKVTATHAGDDNEDDLTAVRSFLAVAGGGGGERGALTKKEDRSVGAVDASVYWSYVEAGTQSNLVLSIVLFVAWQATGMANSIVLSEWSKSDTTSPYFEIMGVVTAVNALFSFLGNMMLGAVFVLRASNVLHDALLRGVVRAPMSFFDATQTGRILNRFSKDVVAMDNEVNAGIGTFVDAVLNVFGAVVIIVYSTPIFLAALVPIFAIYYQVQQYYRPTVRDVKRIESISRSPVYSHFSQSLAGTATIRAMGPACVRRFCEDSTRLVEEMQRATYTSTACNRWLQFRLESLGVAIVIVSVLLSISQYEYGTMDAALAGLSLVYALEITEQFSWVVRSFTQVETSFVAVERILTYAGLKSEPASKVPEADARLSAAGWPASGTVEFRDVSLRYRPELDLVLKGLSFRIEGGTSVGICGRTGAGKSSIIAALFRFVELAGGTILIDGVDITTMGLDMLRDRIGIIPQDPVIFSMSVRDNLDPFRQHSDDEIWEALRWCELQGKVESLPEKLLFLVAENGDNFSVGEKQLFCLARMLLKRTKIIVMDEATASIDAKTDALVQAQIRKIAKQRGATVVTIAHRLNTILDADAILVLDRGTVCEFDAPQTLLAKPGGVFRAMAAAMNIGGAV